MIRKGTVLSLSVDNSKTQYVVIERLDDICRGQGGWLCVETDALVEKGVEHITAFDCWRATDKYLEMKIQTGEIEIINL